MQSCIFLFSGPLAVGSMLLAPTALAQAESTAAWLESDTNWNQSGVAIPEAPVLEGGGNLPNCQDVVRPAALPEDDQVTAAGWTLSGSAQIFGDTTVITGMANADGMCRPLSYQVFVFTDGVFSGTLAPEPMDARTDGSLVSVDLYRQGYLSATFNRYTPEDPLCCPSAYSFLFYEVDTQGEAPLLMPKLPASTNAE
ncbi:MAG: LppP/LprE family lipoprotein [Leptolyngbyaceae cyanobacterium SM2_5_2]|nr:LppP/LprE family lipoprotein [Leptolyngbyaceae cyanobacterium SM2_5_2]